MVSFFLPSELWQIVFDYTELKDRKRIKMVCSLFNKYAKIHSYLKRLYGKHLVIIEKYKDKTYQLFYWYDRQGNNAVSTTLGLSKYVDDIRVVKVDANNVASVKEQILGKHYEVLTICRKN